MDWASSLVALVALWGAALSSYLAYRDWKAKRPRINVTTWLAFLQYPSGGTSEDVVFLEAANPGERTVRLRSMGLVLPDKTRVYFHDPQSEVSFPHELAPEHSCRVSAWATQLAVRLNERGFSEKVKVIGFYDDEVGRTYKSKPYELDMDNIDGGVWKEPSFLGRY